MFLFERSISCGCERVHSELGGSNACVCIFHFVFFCGSGDWGGEGKGERDAQVSNQGADGDACIGEGLGKYGCGVRCGPFLVFLSCTGLYL